MSRPRASSWCCWCGHCSSVAIDVSDPGVFWRLCMSSDSRVLLVGGAGYIGSVLSSHLLENGYSVTCLDRMIYRHHHTVWPFVGCESYRFIRGDIGNPADVERALEDARHVVILAGLVG